MWYSMYVKIRRHQHTRVHAHTGHRPAAPHQSEGMWVILIFFFPSQDPKHSLTTSFLVFSPARYERTHISRGTPRDH